MDKGSISLIDLGSVSEPVTKLIESVSNAIGILYEPTRITRIAKAEVDASIIKAKGEKELEALSLRASQRVNEVELRRQKNIEAVVHMSISQLPDEVSKEPVDEDWIAQFFEYCKDISNERMQSIWARLLAREVTQPNTFSQRTLHTVKMLKPEDALIFEYCTRFFSRGHNLYYYPVLSFLKDKRSLTNQVIDHLSHIGLLSVKLTNTLDQGESKQIVYFDKQFRVTHKTPTLAVYTVYTLTSVGEELYTLCNPEPDLEFLEALREGFRSMGLEVSKITEWREDQAVP